MFKEVLCFLKGHMWRYYYRRIYTPMSVIMVMFCSRCKKMVIRQWDDQYDNEKIQMVRNLNDLDQLDKVEPDHN